MDGGDPFACSRAFIEDNAICMLGYILLCASAYTDTRRADELAYNPKKQKGPPAPGVVPFKAIHDELLKAILNGSIKAFRVCKSPCDVSVQQCN